MILRKLYIGAIILICTLGMYLLFSTSDYKKTQCDLLLSIASNPEKLEYIQIWKDSILSNTILLSKIGYSGRVYPDENPILFKKLNFNWEFMGIDPEFASISLNRNLAERDRIISSENIESLSIGFGRNSLIVQLGSDDLGIPGFNNISKDVKRVSDNLSIYCPGN